MSQVLDIAALKKHGYRTTLLRHYQCPFRDEATCRHEQNPERCQFGHPETVPTGIKPSELRELPHFVCIHYLRGYCREVTTAIPGTDNQKRHCQNGIHLELRQFAQLEQFEKLHTELLRNLLGTDVDLDCGVCLEKVIGKRYRRNRLFGMLENCKHVFCAGCLQAWHSNSSSCPVCRTRSNRILIHHKFIDCPNEKRRLIEQKNPNINFRGQLFSL